MAYAKQSELVRQAEVFIINGARPEAQAVLAGIGYAPATLAAGQTLVNAVKTGVAGTSELRSAQKNATTAEKQARRAAQKEVTSLANTARLLFNDAGATLTALGLQTQFETVIDPETQEETQQAVRPSESTAETIARWRLLATNAASLETTQQADLTAAGWGSARLTALSDLIEAYADADTAQQDAIQNYQQTSAQYTADVAALKDWYGRARRLSTIAIKDADPTNQQNLRELLGL